MSVAVPKQQDTFIWSNFLVNSPIVYSLLEKRVLYYLTLQINDRFVKTQKACTSLSDLCFTLTDSDLRVIGGKKNSRQTYEALSCIGEKFLSIRYYNEKRELIIGKVHWVDSFLYNTQTKQYDVRVSPEVLPYLVNLSNSFTRFNLKTALALKSKYSQKFYEFCCEFSGAFRYKRSNPNELAFKPNVYPIYLATLRDIFGLNLSMQNLKGKGKYRSYNDLCKRVINPAQNELYELYHQGNSNVWFDYMPFSSEGHKVTAIVIFIYSQEKPKQGLPKIWDKADEPLNPYEAFNEEQLQSAYSPYNNISKNEDTEKLLRNIELKLSAYLNNEELNYYSHLLRHSSHSSYDSYHQVLKVIEDKERQAKFQSSNKAYKRKSIMYYALNVNLKESYGWFIPVPSTSIPEHY